MGSAVVRFIDRILRHFGYWRWPISWSAGSDKIARGKRWQAFYNEEGGLKDVIADLRRGYFVKAGHLRPDDLAGLQALSLADRILAEIDGTFRVIIVEGEAEEQAQAHAEKIAKLPEPKRRRL